MDALASTAAIILSVVMLAAATSKLRSLTDTAQTFRQLGLPKPRLVAAFVAVAELAVAAALIIRPSWGAIAGFALLVGFTTYLVNLLRSDKQLGCGCFGSTSTEPVSVADIGRNVALLGLAALAATTTQLTALNIQSVITVSIGFIAVLVGAQLLSLRRQLGSLLHIELAGEQASPSTPAAT